MSTIYDYIPYPELYYMIYPKVNQAIEGYFGGSEITHDMSQAEIEGIIDDIYSNLLSEVPEIQEDESEIKSESVDSLRRPFFGRRRLLRDVVGIIFLGELFRRMGGNRRNNHSPYGYGGYGGYDYFY